jgi:septum formation protein
VQLVLASASPRRADLLRAAGFTFDVRAIDLDERAHEGEPASSYVRRLAMEKSAAALSQIEPSYLGRTLSGPPNLVVLGADTAVVVDGRILGKPASDLDAEAMLRQLSGRRHEVLTGVSLRTPGVELGTVESTAVFFAPIGDQDVDWYVKSGEGRDKAGAYAIQGLAARFIDRIDGSYSNVVGLPIAAVHKLMRELASSY